MSSVTLAEILRAPEWADAQLPSADEEVWRYSRIAELDLADFTPAGHPGEGPSLPEEVGALVGSLPERAGVVVSLNGYVVLTELAERWASKGVHFGRAADANGHEASGSEASEQEPPVDLFARLNRALSPDPVLLRVPRGVMIDEPFLVIDWLDGAGVATFPRLHVEAGEASQLTVVEWSGSTDVAALALPVVSLDVGPAARLRHVTVQDRGHAVWQIASQLSSVGQEATLLAMQAGLGGDYSRSRTDCRLVGRGATGDLLAAYFGEGSQMLDYRTFQDHIAADTTSNLLFKGVVSDQSHSVYTGLIHVGKEARGTNAFQTNNNIKLSEGAWAESVPNLEIENSDVRCSHASTVGPIGEDQRFYLESRGVPTEVAERLLVTGFFAEVFEQVPVPTVARLLELEMDRRLGR